MRASVNRNTIITSSLVAVLILAVCATVLIVVLPQPGEPFTELYLLGPNRKASDYPTNLTVNQTGKVTVGVINHENANVNYTLRVTLASKTIQTQSFRLANNQTWERSLSFTPHERGMGQKLEFALYKNYGKQAYRSVYLYLTVT